MPTTPAMTTNVSDSRTTSMTTSMTTTMTTTATAQPAIDYDWLRDPARASWFWERMLIGTTPEVDHWLWIGDEGTRLASGHVRIWYFGTRWLQHRLAYVLAGGSLEDGEMIRHRCPGDPRPDCGSIFHLSAGSALDNSRDRDLAGRRTPFLPRGEAHWSSRLSQADAERIREAKQLGVHVDDISRIFKISRATVYAVLSRARYTEPVG